MLLGDLFAKSNDVLRAGVAFSKACEAGVPAGCYGQAMVLIQSGADLERGKQLLDKACRGGDLRACQEEFNPEL